MIGLLLIAFMKAARIFLLVNILDF